MLRYNAEKSQTARLFLSTNSDFRLFRALAIIQQFDRFA